MKYLKLFTKHSDYTTAKNSLDKPNVSLCDLEDEVHFNSLSYSVSLLFNFRVLPGISTHVINSDVLSSVSAMEIDGVKLTTPVSSYEFDTTGEHIVRFKFSSPEIPLLAFSYVGCDELSISDNVTTINQGAFQNSEIPKVSIGKGVTIIDGYALNTSYLEELTVKATTPPTLLYNALYSGSYYIFVPAESVNAYKAASGWVNLASYIQAIPD